jgi:hypothetical protein
MERETLGNGHAFKPAGRSHEAINSCKTKPEGQYEQMSNRNEMVDESHRYSFDRNHRWADIGA